MTAAPTKNFLKNLDVAIAKHIPKDAHDKSFVYDNEFVGHLVIAIQVLRGVVEYPQTRPPKVSFLAQNTKEHDADVQAFFREWLEHAAKAQVTVDNLFKVQIDETKLADKVTNDAEVVHAGC